jgi:hypothetical protein
MIAAPRTLVDLACSRVMTRSWDLRACSRARAWTHSTSVAQAATRETSGSHARYGYPRASLGGVCASTRASEPGHRRCAR